MNRPPTQKTRFLNHKDNFRLYLFLAISFVFSSFSTYAQNCDRTVEVEKIVETKYSISDTYEVGDLDNNSIIEMDNEKVQITTTTCIEDLKFSITEQYNWMSYSEDERTFNKIHMDETGTTLYQNSTQLLFQPSSVSALADEEKFSFVADSFDFYAYGLFHKYSFLDTSEYNEYINEGCTVVFYDSTITSTSTSYIDSARYGVSCGDRSIFIDPYSQLFLEFNYDQNDLIGRNIELRKAVSASMSIPLLETNTKYYESDNGIPLKKTTITEYTSYEINSVDYLQSTGISSIVNKFKEEKQFINSFNISEKSEMQSPVRIFPNPSRDIIFIQDKDNHEFTYEIMSSSGTKVSSGTAQQSVSISELPTGVYFIKLSYEGVVVTKKFLKY